MLSPTECDAIAEAFLPMVKRIVGFYRSSGVDPAELESAALLGLTLSLRGYDPERGDLQKRIMYFAHRQIRRAIKQERGLDGKGRGRIVSDIAHAIAEPDRLDDDAAAWRMSPDTANVEGEVIALEERRALIRATRSVTHEDLQLLLDTEQGVRQSSLARDYGVSKQAIQKRVERARRLMRDALLADVEIER